RYYDEAGESIGNYFLRYPVRFSRISSVFSTSRFHPILQRRKVHNGVDFAAPTGTPVRSVADGIVLSASYNRASGNMVKIRHTNKYSTAYLHLSRIAKGLRKGQRVKRGEVIGAVGSTGYATGPHLHYSLYENGRYVDPMKTKLPKMPEHVSPIPQDLLQATLAQVKGSLQQAQIAYQAQHAGQNSSLGT
ncbi:MAG: M23 family metallopeptidase, partial [Bdellovibrionales bacterium]|nr:M23 family metallopeptidase [Bdellovibrionales bacterium]